MSGFYKRNIDGTIQSANTQLDSSWLPLSDLSVDADNNYYKYYNQDGTPNTEKILQEDTKNLLESIESSIQDMLDKKAQELGYDNIVSACSYAGYDNKFQVEAISLGKWRSNVWDKAYELQNSMTEVPTIEEVLSQLPSFE
jgi:hypothetical protein